MQYKEGNDRTTLYWVYLDNSPVSKGKINSCAEKLAAHVLLWLHSSPKKFCIALPITVDESQSQRLKLRYVLRDVFLNNSFSVWSLLLIWFCFSSKSSKKTNKMLVFSLRPKDNNICQTCIYLETILSSKWSEKGSWRAEKSLLDTSITENCSILKDTLLIFSLNHLFCRGIFCLIFFSCNSLSIFC